MADDNKTLALHRSYKAARRKSTLTETMALSLPRWRPAGEKRSHCGSPMVSTKYPVVAVIDDDPSVLDAMTRLLSIHGFDIELYVSPHKFLEAVVTTQAICLIVNVQMRDGCGVEFVRQLANRGITFPVIFIGGSDNEEVERRAMETGCVAFFRKPFSAYLLMEALDDLSDYSYSAERPVM